MSYVHSKGDKKGSYILTLKADENFDDVENVVKGKAKTAKIARKSIGDKKIIIIENLKEDEVVEVCMFFIIMVDK